MSILQYTCTTSSAHYSIIYSFESKPTTTVVPCQRTGMVKDLVAFI